ncbi:hypothetical protein D3C77_440240 [compost metagenome]
MAIQIHNGSIITNETRFQLVNIRHIRHFKSFAEVSGWILIIAVPTIANFCFHVAVVVIP